MYQVPKEYTQNLKNQIDLALKSQDHNPIAAFDADGTCWFSDVGRDFFSHQSEHKFFAGNNQYTWDHYKALEEKDMEAALLWMSQILNGLKVEDVRAFGEDCIKWSVPNYVAFTKEIIDHLHKRGVAVYIVTASVKWTVEAGAKYFGIPEERVIGVTTKIKEDGTFTAEQDGPVTWYEGKVKGLLEKTNGKKPFYVSGNTMSDVPMMKSSTAFKVVINSVTPEDSIYQSEVEALNVAKKENWNYLDYRSGEFHTP